MGGFSARIRARFTFGRPGDARRRQLKKWIASWKDPRITVCIPSRDHVEDLLLPCLDSLERTSHGYPIDVLIADSGSSAQTFQAYDDLALPYVQVEGPFSFAKSCNRMARTARGKDLLFLNNDTTALSPDWARRLLGEPPQGVLGALLVYPTSHDIQHAGVEVIRVRGESDIPHGYRPSPSRFRSEDFPVMVRHLGVGLPLEHAARIDQSRCIAVTGAFLCTPKHVFWSLGGFDEQYRTDLQDTDYCLKARERGLPVACSTEIVFSHVQSASRVGYQFPEDDWRLFLSRWRSVLEGVAQDPTSDGRP